MLERIVYNYLNYYLLYLIKHTKKAFEKSKAFLISDRMTANFG